MIHDRVLREQPWVAGELFAAFKAAKAEYMTRINAGRDLNKADEQALALGKGIGGDPFPFGLSANRKALETIVRFTHDQRAIGRNFKVEELFAAELTDV